MAKSSKHPGFKAVASKVAKSEGVPADRAAAIVAAAGNSVSACTAKVPLLSTVRDPELSSTCTTLVTLVTVLKYAVVVTVDVPAGPVMVCDSG